MSAGLAAAALALAFGVTALTLPLAITVAVRTGFLDRPTGYKAHVRATPYLGGAPVVAATVLAFLALGRDPLRLWPLAAAALVLWAVGTLDDRRMLGVSPRLAATGAAGVLLWSLDLGWSLFGAGVADLAFTVIWVVAVVNAMNLMDNLDGAAGAVAAAAGAGIGALALIVGDDALGVVGLALAGACLAFLRINLARPSRIFLGDGGSMPVGLVLATAAMALPTSGEAGSRSLLVGILLVGLPLLDTTLVIVSRRRRALPVLQGARDHLTHRLLARLGSARRVALSLAAAQAGLCGLAVLASESGLPSRLGLGAALAAGLLLVALLDSPAWAPSPAPGPAGASPALANRVLTLAGASALVGRRKGSR